MWMPRPVLVRPDPLRYTLFPSLEKAWLALEPGHSVTAEPVEEQFSSGSSGMEMSEPSAP